MPGVVLFCRWKSVTLLISRLSCWLLTGKITWVPVTGRPAMASCRLLAIAEEADAQMQEKRVVNSAVNIAENKTKMKVRFGAGP